METETFGGLFLFVQPWVSCYVEIWKGSPCAKVDAGRQDTPPQPPAAEPEAVEGSDLPEADEAERPNRPAGETVFLGLTEGESETDSPPLPACKKCASVIVSL